jgi:hypothetical protein
MVTVAADTAAPEESCTVPLTDAFWAEAIAATIIVKNRLRTAVVALNGFIVPPGPSWLRTTAQLLQPTCWISASL